MQCDYFDAGVCRSCTLMGVGYDAQLAGKVADAEGLLAAWADAVWLPPVPSAPEAFRNKAKMVVGGTVEAPTLGILDAERHGVDLQGCGVLAPGLRGAFPAITAFIARARIVPYDIPARRGELKHVLLTESPDGRLMLRWVLRSTEALGRIRKHLPELLAGLPQLAVVTANLLPEHKAVLEGEEEVALTADESLAMRLDDVTLHLRPGSFFQTNTAIAAGLYRQARAWVDELAPRSVWDLYCGVGGFALHVAAPGRRVLGVEVSAPAIASARLSAAEAGLVDVSFEVGDATAVGGADAPELVIVNPPRRGLGAELCATLESSRVGSVVYSSCNAASLARDLAAMPSLRPERIRVFDMFPQTTHYEVMVLLRRVHD
ncbi:23S rRNA (uracil(747)-C(5))-methyltransferase RlmC [Protaetiibacter intestinalis]|uniref:23S rRNA (Uracil(747)-C(5))-methyltransferase RlmC n=1 Tax=Protaetiibacter intestinalis TaxID=2419774 RepID=A0A387B973_9MICO|nr:23S rRNA (uracil(747)-C(5))-methyltransferase RlmC [Protaetiibacter intestinalis]AYF97646.1 23S rRNA (uracil(747)-C(5))-methyltransferase RlmC [Protaetiibacter intestinalis]